LSNCWEEPLWDNHDYHSRAAKTRALWAGKAQKPCKPVRANLVQAPRSKPVIPPLTPVIQPHEPVILLHKPAILNEVKDLQLLLHLLLAMRFPTQSNLMVRPSEQSAPHPNAEVRSSLNGMARQMMTRSGFRRKQLRQQWAARREESVLLARIGYLPRGQSTRMRKGRRENR